MPDEDDVQRLRENLTRALRYAEVSRAQAHDAEHFYRKLERQARRNRSVTFICACATLVSFVAMMIWGLTR